MIETSEQLNIENYTSSSDETFWSYFKDVKVVVNGAIPYTDKDDNGNDVSGVKAKLRDPVERDGNKYTTLKTTWSSHCQDFAEHRTSEEIRGRCRASMRGQKGRRQAVLYSRQTLDHSFLFLEIPKEKKFEHKRKSKHDKATASYAAAPFGWDVIAAIQNGTREA